MTNRGLFRATAIAIVLVAAIAATRAFTLQPVYANAISFTSSSTQSSVLVVVQNPNPFAVGGTLTLVVNTPSGVPRTWPVGTIYIPPGNSYQRVLIPGPITGVRWARITNVVI
jgi:hypothetical protein